MKNTIIFFFLLLAAAVSAQSNSFVTDRLRAAEYFRIGTNTSQKVTGFDRVITAPGTHDSLPTSRAVVDFLEANFTPIGYYTAGTGISISDDVITNSAPDQVVGLTGGGITVITGTYPNFTITSNEVDGSVTNELQNLSLSGQSLSISSGTGVTLPVVGVSAGTGIGVSGSSGTFTVTNTGDLSTTNEIQTLSLSGSDLTLSDGGGTVTLPADGNGIYGGSGTVPDGTVATIGSKLRIKFGDIPLLFDRYRIESDHSTPGNMFSFNISDGGVGFTANKSTAVSDFGADGSNMFFTATRSPMNFTTSKANSAINFNTPMATLVFSTNNDNVKFTDLRATKKGIEYAAYYPDILTNDRSIIDVGLTKQLISSENGALGTGFTGGGGSGTIPDGTIAAVGTNSMRFGDISTFLTDIGSAIGTYSTPQNFELTGYNDGADGQFGHFFSGKLDDYEAKITYDAYGLKVEASPDNNSTINALYVTGDGISITSADGLGAQYAAEYPDILTNDRSLPDVGTVNLLKQTPVSYTNAAAPNNTIFYSTTDSKLSYKDPAGVVHNLY